VRRIWSTLWDHRDWVAYVYVPIIVPILVLLPYLAISIYQSGNCGDTCPGGRESVRASLRASERASSSGPARLCQAILEQQRASGSRVCEPAHWIHEFTRGAFPPARSSSRLARLICFSRKCLKRTDRVLNGPAQDMLTRGRPTTPSAPKLLRRE
jgi:hypothetical protein